MFHNISNAFCKQSNIGYHRLKRKNVFNNIGKSLRKRSIVFDKRISKYNATTNNLWNIPRESASKMALSKIIQNIVHKTSPKIKTDINENNPATFFHNDYINSALNVTYFKNHK